MGTERSLSPVTPRLDPFCPITSTLLLSLLHGRLLILVPCSLFYFQAPCTTSSSQSNSYACKTASFPLTLVFEIAELFWRKKINLRQAVGLQHFGPNVWLGKITSK